MHIGTANLGAKTSSIRIITEEVMKLYHKVEKYNENLKKQDNYKELCNNKMICWHSDDYPYDVSDVLKIYKQNEEIILEFTKNKIEDYDNAVSIRFRNSRSHYAPFNCFLWICIMS